MDQIAATRSGGGVVGVVDQGVAWFLRHWLAVVNGSLAAYLGLAMSAPLLQAAGREGFARLIYTAFGFVCHQRLERSFHLDGEQMAFCQRDTAIFAAMLIGGLVFAAMRARLAPLSLRVLATLALPMAVDGLTQLVGLRESTWELRVLTGGLFGLGIVWLVLPHLQRGFAADLFHEPHLRARYIDCR